MSIAEDMARVHYEAYEWSGCNGSRWDAMPDEVRQRLTLEADRWRASAQSAGYSIIPADSLRALNEAAAALMRLGHSTT